MSRKKNSFYFFMKEMQENYKKEGIVKSMNEITQVAYPIWKALPDQEKQKYEKMANDCKNMVLNNLFGKRCCTGESLLEIMEKEQEKLEKEESAAKFVEEMVFKMSDKEEVVETFFYIVCFNVLCSTDDCKYIPNEIGIVKYSIRHGIDDSFHRFIDPGPIPFGYARACKDHSEETHQIPIFGFKLYCRNYIRLCKDIINFVNPDRKDWVHIFSLGKDIEQNQGCIDWLCKKADFPEMECLQFHDLVNLLMELRAYARLAFPSRVVATDMLESHVFDYIPKTRCDFHEDIDNKYCALGSCKRFCFVFSDALCKVYNVNYTSHHIPPRVGDTELEINQSGCSLLKTRDMVKGRSTATEDPNRDSPVFLSARSSEKNSIPKRIPVAENGDKFKSPITNSLLINIKDKKLAVAGIGRGIGRGNL